MRLAIDDATPRRFAIADYDYDADITMLILPQRRRDADILLILILPPCHYAMPLCFAF